MNYIFFWKDLWEYLLVINRYERNVSWILNINDFILKAISETHKSLQFMIIIIIMNTVDTPNNNARISWIIGSDKSTAISFKYFFSKDYIKILCILRESLDSLYVITGWYFVSFGNLKNNMLCVQKLLLLININDVSCSSRTKRDIFYLWG